MKQIIKEIYLKIFNGLNIRQTGKYIDVEILSSTALNSNFEPEWVIEKGYIRYSMI